MEKLQKQVQAEREETRRTKEELGNLRSAAEEMVRTHQHTRPLLAAQLILPPASGVSNEGVLPSWPSCRLFLDPGFRLAARWNRLVETVKTRKRREKTGK